MYALSRSILERHRWMRVYTRTIKAHSGAIALHG